MANFLEKVNYSTMSMPKAMNRTNPAPLDASAIWTSLEELQNYAATSPVAYIGQILSLVAHDAETGDISEVKAYIIKDTEGHIEEVGSATLGDDSSIELVDGVLSVKGFGKRYYKYIAEDGEEPAHYEPVDVDADHPWVAGLEPRVVNDNGNLVIGWYEPNPTTVDGVQDQVTAVQGDVAQAKADIDALEEDIVVVEEKVETINKDLYGYTAEGGEVVEGLVDKVEAIEGQVSDLEDAVANTYTKEEVNGLVSGVFHFEGTAESYDALPAEGNTKGDVYQVGDKEYAWNGTTWVELGFVVDLTAYATTEYVDGEIETVEGIIETLSGTVSGHTSAIETINGEIAGLKTADEGFTSQFETVNGEIAGLKKADEGFTSQFETVNGRLDALEEADKAFETINGRLDALEAADLDFASQLETIDGAIKDLQDVDTGFETRIKDLEDDFAVLDSDFTDLSAAVGTASTLQTALFPAVEALQSRIDGLVAVGGEANLINGLTINGQALTPNAEKIVDLPVFDGSKIGFVPVVGEDVVKNTSFLSAEGAWVNVANIIDDKIAEVISWEEISD